MNETVTVTETDNTAADLKAAEAQLSAERAASAASLAELSAETLAAQVTENAAQKIAENEANVAEAAQTALDAKGQSEWLTNKVLQIETDLGELKTLLQSTQETLLLMAPKLSTTQEVNQTGQTVEETITETTQTVKPDSEESAGRGSKSTRKKERKGREGRRRLRRL